MGILSLKQATKVLAAINFPGQSSAEFFTQELPLEESRKIISFCEYPQKKPEAVQKELSDVYEKYSYKCY